MKKIFIEIDTPIGVKKYLIEMISNAEVSDAFRLKGKRRIGELKSRTQAKILAILIGCDKRADRRIFRKYLTLVERVHTINKLFLFAQYHRNSTMRWEQVSTPKRGIQKIEGGLHVQAEA